ASSKAPRRAGDGRRGSPEMRNVSSWYPASGTSCASMRSGDPANVTCAPRRCSASATASDGATCPAVPPAAIRHRSCRPCSTAGDVKEDPDGEERHHEARAPVGDERQWDSGQRREPEDGGQVDGGLAADECDDADGQALAERVLADQRNPQPC